MKDYKHDSTDAVARFGRDKRVRTVKAEHVEHTSRTPRESEPRNDFGPKPRRRSFNPNFDAENRPIRDFSRRPAYDESRDNDYRQPRYENRDGAADRKPYRPERKSRFDERPNRFGNNDFSERRYERSKPFGERSRDFDADSSAAETRRPYGRKNDYGLGEERPAQKFAGKRNDNKKGFAKRPKAAADKPKTYPKYKPEMPNGEIRLNRFIAQSGLCSRREADTYITAGVVTVNGRVVTELGTKILPTDEVRFNDETIRGEQNVYLVLNKPKGYVTTLDDPHATKIVTDLVKDACKERIYPVGRLDKNSLGLLLFTNDGDLTKQLTHPSYNKKKTYQVSLDKPLTRADMDAIVKGITLEDGDIYADEIAYIKEDKKEIGIEIHSGRNRIVRRIFEHLGYTVLKLDRVYYAGLTKKNLKRGAWRFLTKEEVRNLKSGMYE